jgi:TolB-like protein/DNA-binding winged helix-turn-helix (wHTH) protein
MDGSNDASLQIGPWRIDPKLGQATRGDETTRIEVRSMRLLLYLAERAGQTVSIEELLEQVWSGVVVTPDSVYQAVASLRRQLGDDTKQPTIIATIPRLGYRLIAPVDRTGGAPNATKPGADSPAAAPAARLSRRQLAIAIAALLVAVAGASYRERYARSDAAAASRPAHPPKSVAVLPFLDLTTNEMNEEYFADGMTEELIGDLSKVPGLKVPAPTSAFLFKGKRLPIADVARQLGVAYIVDGSVRKADDVFRVAARLVRVTDGFVSWTETYDRRLGNVVELQKDIAGEAAQAIRASIDADIARDLNSN